MTAPKKFEADGASIPQLFWTVVGGPLDGQYRNASIVHDVGCVRMTDKWEDVHLMFYEACRCGGVPENKAKVVYAAVYHWGPRWVITERQEVREITAPDGTKQRLTVTVHVPQRLMFATRLDPEVPRKLETLID